MVHPGPHASVTPRKKLRRQRCLAVLLGCGAALFLLEAELRFYNPLGARVRADKIVVPAFEQSRIANNRIPQLDPLIVCNRNVFGFRGPPPPEKFNECVTIIAVGGSTTECRYLTDGRTWPDRLSEHLKSQANIDCLWVNNAGFDGHSTFGHLVLLTDYIVRIKPRYVVVLSGINDVGRDDLNDYDRNLVPKSWRSRIRTALSHSETFVLLDNARRLYAANSGGLNHSFLALDQLPTAGTAGRLSEQDKRAYTASLKSYQERLLAIVELCEKHAIRPVFLTQPCLWGGGIDDRTGVDLNRVEVPGRKLCGEAFWELLELYNDVTRGICAAHDLPLVDLARALPKDSTYFYDGFHFTNSGAEKVAEIVGRTLAPVLVRDGSASGP